MKLGRLIGILLIVLGLLAMAYGGFSYTKKRKEASLGPLKVEFKKEEHVDLPVWAGPALVGVGLLVTFAARNRS